ncbi:nuclear transport factor 2 family protein [Endozoicomonas sp. SCSIO W0465]|uniref:nuclear transport factor 2 family protein n=1 Tax=Endozoicomonas sp. SCSIO W0465 TaxID=2918516 RepID=UPI002074E3CA|nr:nuclear transport factor 2 family protein [Endozoicomonas sp. SCSIO W0465]USE36193.1 nuclear transport factor 2 family protein [Endozoicomonas sp. SCSIO W0465]
MSLVTNFLNEFRDCLLNGSKDGVLELTMPDDITGWGVTESHDFNNPDDLCKQSARYFAERESADIQLEPLDSFGNGRAMMVACRCKRDIRFKNGLRLKDDDLRLTFYLIEHQGSLKIRHSHISKAWPEIIPFPVNPVPHRPRPELSGHSARLDSICIAPVLDALNKRVNYSEAADLRNLIMLQHPSQSRVYFPLNRPDALRGSRQYEQYLGKLAERHLHPQLKYHHPVAFQNQSLICLSAYAETGWQEKATGERVHASPLRVTYILQEHEGQWLCRHGHWSLPCPDVG